MLESVADADQGDTLISDAALDKAAKSLADFDIKKRCLEADAYLFVFFLPTEITGSEAEL